MDQRLLLALCLGGSVLAAGLSCACLVKLESLERRLRPRRPRQRGPGGHGWGRLIHFPDGDK